MIEYILLIPNMLFKFLFGGPIHRNLKARKIYLDFAKFLSERGLPPPLAVCSHIQERGWRNIDIGGKYLDLEVYKNCDDSTNTLFDNVLPLIDKDAKILEIGCSVGRNLDYLYKKGYKNLTGIDISPRAIELMEVYFPEMSKTTKKIVGNAPEAIKRFDTGSFDLVFCHSVLVNISSKYNHIFREMCRVSNGYIATFENEGTYKAYPRDFRKMFERHGFKMISSKFFVRRGAEKKMVCPDTISDDDLFLHMMLRIFTKEGSLKKKETACG